MSVLQVCTLVGFLRKREKEDLFFFFFPFLPEFCSSSVLMMSMTFLRTVRTSVDLNGLSMYPLMNGLSLGTCSPRLLMRITLRGLSSRF